MTAENYRQAFAEYLVAAGVSPPEGVTKPTQVDVADRALRVAAEMERGQAAFREGLARERRDLQVRTQFLVDQTATRILAAQSHGAQEVEKLEKKARRANRAVEDFSRGPMAPVRRLLGFIASKGKDTLASRQAAHDAVCDAIVREEEATQVQVRNLASIKPEKTAPGIAMLTHDLNQREAKFEEEMREANSVAERFTKKAELVRDGYIHDVANALPQDLSDIPLRTITEIRKGLPEADRAGFDELTAKIRQEPAQDRGMDAPSPALA